MSLDVDHHLDDGPAGDRPPNAVSGHPVQFRDAVDHDQFAVVGILARVAVGGGSRLAVEDELVVDIIEDQVDVFPFAELHDSGDEGLRVDRPRGIVRAVHDHHLGVRADRPLDILQAGNHGSILRRHDHRNAVNHLDDLGVTDPVRRQDYHFILWVQQREENVEQRLFGSR